MPILRLHIQMLSFAVFYGPTLILVYLLAAFVMGDLNAMNWDQAARGLMVFFLVPTLMLNAGLAEIDGRRPRFVKEMIDAIP